MKSATLALCILRPGILSEMDADVIRRLPCDVPCGVASEVLAQIARGESKVCHIERDGERVGFIVFSVLPNHELVINAAFGRDRRENLVDALIGDGALILSLARQCECDSVRFHTVRAGLVKRATEHGFRVSEIIMRKVLG